MKRFFKFIITSILVVSSAFLIYKITDKYDLQVKYSDINWGIKTKGVEEATSFHVAKDNTLYIAYKDSISILKGNNKEVVIDLDDLDIYDVVVSENNLFIASDNRVIQYDLDTDMYEVIIKEIPNYGLNKYTKLLLDGEYLYITVGSNTNSGVVENNKDEVDRPSFSWISTGECFGDNKTSGFCEYGVTRENGEVSEESKISNASILRYSIVNKEVKMFASGIRNVEGFDISEDGKIISIVGGMNNSGARAICNDSDYIYELKENSWYGWPDYSGGDPVTSSRFAKPNVKMKNIISNHPTKSVYGPIYQHNSLSSISGLTIAKEDGVLKKGTVVFADNSAKQINILSKDGVAMKIAELADESLINKIISSSRAVYMLDKGTGCIYELKCSDENRIFYMHDLVKVFTIIFLLIIGMCVVYKINSKGK